MSFTLWRGVVGMVRPTRRPGTLEELIRILPEGIGVVPLMLNFKAGSNAEFLASIPLYQQFASELAEQGVDLIMLTGAPPFMLLGPEKEAELTRDWEKKFKTPVVTDPQMQVAGLRAMKIKKFIGASYSALQNKIVLDYMTAAGFEALSMEPIDVPFDQVAQISVERLYSHVKALLPQESRRRRHLYPGRRLADHARRRDAGERSPSSRGARDACRGLDHPQASRGARNQAGLRPVAGGIALAIESCVMMRAVQALRVAVIAAGFACCAGATHAQSQVSVLIGTTPGGGYDVYARALARHIGRHLPGNPTVIPKNMPGAGGLTLANYIYNKAPTDGSEFATVQNGLPFEKLFQTLSEGGKNALFDATKFGWVGSITQTVFVTVTWHTAPVKTLKDATERPAILGASATSSDSYVLAMLSNRLLGTKFKVVHGYPGAAEVDLAVENGEVQGEAGKDWTTLTSTRPQWIKDKTINILFQMGMKPHAELKDVPMAIDLARTPDDRRIMEIVFAKFGMSRPFFAPPGIAPERLATLRRAFDETVHDEAFLADAAKLGMEINPVRGEDVQALVTRIMSTPPELAQRTRDILKPQ